MKIKKNDLIIVIAGKDKGKTGKVLEAMPDTKKILVEGVNMVTKHVKAKDKVPGGIMKTERPVDVSNVMIIDPGSNKPSRIGYKIEKGQKKVRYAKVSGEILP
ncbi:MAG: 50S ribosomal protein L24 [Candidatus Abawacabacteria bacterium RBG_16_42_10]|uniref:Large ribosomal subunit protein uL24 n=1 Tax=Candidatus Abawacabacteria bacterium RBG_16_42_10 TaxID=1817814 RepID=A0A1F4XIE5_9BACT|nr:ribosomal protein L24 [uncultured bacterium]OGC81396.1 MAG: 50S ribosomal protein L24 [Candidatus Abawacabacteria bacterium RBG_16_42_10]